MLPSRSRTVARTRQWDLPTNQTPDPRLVVHQLLHDWAVWAGHLALVGVACLGIIGCDIPVAARHSSVTSSKGLSIIGVTNEPAGLTEKWVEDHDVKYAYAYDKSGKLSRQLGVAGIPHSFLLDPSGQIVWRGHPMSLQASTIKEHLDGALELPIWEWPKELSTVKKSMLGQRYGKALAAADKLIEKDQSATKYRDAIQFIVDGKVGVLTASIESGDFLGAQMQGNLLKKQLDDLPEAEIVEEALSSISKDKEAKVIINAQKALARLRAARIRKKSDVVKVVRQVERLAEKHPGSFVETEAMSFIAELEALATTLR